MKQLDLPLSALHLRKEKDSFYSIILIAVSEVHGDFVYEEITAETAISVSYFESNNWIDINIYFHSSDRQSNHPSHRNNAIVNIVNIIDANLLKYLWVGYFVGDAVNTIGERFHLIRPR